MLEDSAGQTIAHLLFHQRSNATLVQEFTDSKF